MMRGLRPAVWPLAGFLCAAGFSCGVAVASVGKAPRVEISCLRSQTVLQPEGGSLSDADPGVKVRLNEVTICKIERRACFAHQEEVPMSRCSALN